MTMNLIYNCTKNVFEESIYALAIMNYREKIKINHAWNTLKNSFSKLYKKQNGDNDIWHSLKTPAEWMINFLIMLSED